VIQIHTGKEKKGRGEGNEKKGGRGLKEREGNLPV
jgi:hypothetical protein